eukprot:TRINITY_DN5635_c0_g1_i1.p3 TRINITY_DN5635_c0_g1~~TRINITY_DN5635_c0_g1_i1.p3  ORF type:complete len:50 (-),score=7.69 TRINITY_DN5635_c0_g1_i1:318-467(-)
MRLWDNYLGRVIAIIFGSEFINGKWTLQVVIKIICKPFARVTVGVINCE